MGGAIRREQENGSGRKRMIYQASGIFVPRLDLLAIAAAIQNLKHSRLFDLAQKCKSTWRWV